MQIQKKRTFIKDPFLRLYAFLQLGGNLYYDKGELDPNKVCRIINNQDYEYFQPEVEEFQQAEQYHYPMREKYSCFLHFYQCLGNVKLNTYDLTLISNFQKILSPLELFKNALKRSLTLIASAIIFIHPFILFTSALTCIVGAIVCPIPVLSTVAVLSFFVFMLGAVDSLIVDIRHNKKIKREQNQFKQKTKEDITKKIEIGKDITPETQNSIFDPLLKSDNKPPSDLSDFSDFSEVGH